MPKMIVGRRVTYLEVYEVDTDEIPSMRDNLDLCQRVLWAADPVLTQRLKAYAEWEKPPIKLICRTLDQIIENPIYPVKFYQQNLDEAPEVG